LNTLLSQHKTKLKQVHESGFRDTPANLPDDDRDRFNVYIKTQGEFGYPGKLITFLSCLFFSFLLLSLLFLSFLFFSFVACYNLIVVLTLVFGAPVGIVVYYITIHCITSHCTTLHYIHYPTLVHHTLYHTTFLHTTYRQ
jgi:hypothetical protein